MTDNLNEMIQETPADEGAQFVPENLELAEDPSDEVAPIEPEATINEIAIVTLGGWFEKYGAGFTNLHQVRVAIRGVDPLENLLISIDDPEGAELADGQRKRSLKLFDDALIQPVLDLEPSSMQIYNNGFRVIYPINDDIFIKMYGVKTGLIAMFCYAIGNGLLPYAKFVAKKRVETIEIQTGDIESYRQQWTQPIDLETMHLLYRQSVKSDAFATKGAAINWLLDRQDGITDINHHLEIDKVIMTLLN